MGNRNEIPRKPLIKSEAQLRLPQPRWEPRWTASSRGNHDLRRISSRIITNELEAAESQEFSEIEGAASTVAKRVDELKKGEFQQPQPNTEGL